MKYILLRITQDAGFFLLFTLCTLSLNAQRVRLFTPDEGLSNSHINQIYQDSKGYIWIATENGLNKFDGYDFEVFLSIPTDSILARAIFVSAVYEDSRGWFWVASSNGLLRYDRSTNTFLRWEMGAMDEDFKGRRASYIYEDQNHHLWISYPGHGVVRLDADTLLPLTINDSNSTINSKYVYCIFEDRHGNLWFGSEDLGVFVFDPQNNTTKHFHAANHSGLNNDKVFSIIENGAGEIWVGTMGGGINVFDEQTQTFHALNNKGINPLAKKRC